jgi:hypothetical protein
MPSITEGDLTFDFSAGWEIAKLDDWSFYRNQFQRVCKGTKAVDILAIEPGLGCVWCIEVKDYRRNRRSKSLSVAEEIACKVRDSLAMLAAARVNANDAVERRWPTVRRGLGRSRSCSTSSNPPTRPGCSPGKSIWPMCSKVFGSS